MLDKECAGSGPLTDSELRRAREEKLVQYRRWLWANGKVLTYEQNPDQENSQ